MLINKDITHRPTKHQFSADDHFSARHRDKTPAINLHMTARTKIPTGVALLVSASAELKNKFLHRTRTHYQVCLPPPRKHLQSSAVTLRLARVTSALPSSPPAWTTATVSRLWWPARSWTGCNVSRTLLTLTRPWQRITPILIQLHWLRLQNPPHLKSLHATAPPVPTGPPPRPLGNSIPIEI